MTTNSTSSDALAFTIERLVDGYRLTVQVWHKGEEVTHKTVNVYTTLDEARSVCSGLGLTAHERFDSDPPSVIETWS